VQQPHRPTPTLFDRHRLLTCTNDSNRPVYVWFASRGSAAGHHGHCERCTLRSRERRLESCYAPLGTLAVSDSGSETGAASRVHVWPDAVTCGQLDRAQCSDRHIHSSSGSLFECLRGSGRRGRRFKSGHPDPGQKICNSCQTGTSPGDHEQGCASSLHQDGLPRGVRYREMQ
jgi:hypothetical protein